VEKRVHGGKEKMNPHLDELISLCKHPATVVQEGVWELG